MALLLGSRGLRVEGALEPGGYRGGPSAPPQLGQCPALSAVSDSRGLYVVVIAHEAIAGR